MRNSDVTCITNKKINKLYYVISNVHLSHNNQLLTPTKMRTLVLVPTENKRYITADKINSVGQESGSRRLTVQQRWIVLENKPVVLTIM